MIDSLGWLPYVVVGFVVGVPGLAGAGLIVAAAWRWLKLRSLGASGERATAQVVDNQMESRSRGRITFRPVVTFQAGSGPEVTAVLADLTGFRSHVAGTTIDVLYDPRKPTEAKAVRAGGKLLAIPLAFGLLFLLFAFGAYEIGQHVIAVFNEVGAAEPGGFQDPGFGQGPLTGP
ncbi:Protein of unknown function [Asanoa hainanensis]|uniref:DUF3592 domain-containing protein n=1 Tax=Asanoa hainanensis TaxID=560556 RepID=A0A239P8L7_9ACTN|nr:DUF3592 domain-containing protein [Asanoa hainanensis]SNT63430.1 Protein of unknown function [Asanoa hainanensis]